MIRKMILDGQHIIWSSLFIGLPMKHLFREFWAVEWIHLNNGFDNHYLILIHRHLSYFVSFILDGCASNINSTIAVVEVVDECLSRPLFSPWLVIKRQPALRYVSVWHRSKTKEDCLSFYPSILMHWNNFYFMNFPNKQNLLFEKLRFISHNTNITFKK